MDLNSAIWEKVAEILTNVPYNVAHTLIQNNVKNSQVQAYKIQFYNNLRRQAKEKKL